MLWPVPTPRYHIPSAGVSLTKHRRQFMSFTRRSIPFACNPWMEQRSLAEPGRSFATIAVPTAAALALSRPQAQHLPLFPV